MPSRFECHYQQLRTRLIKPSKRLFDVAGFSIHCVGITRVKEIKRRIANQSIALPQSTSMLKRDLELSTEQFLNIKWSLAQRARRLNSLDSLHVITLLYSPFP